MKLVYSRIFKSCSQPGFSRALFFSTETPTSKDTLFRRISPVGDPHVSIVPVLDKWIEEGRSVKRGELQSIVGRLRVYRRFKHALEVSQWMSDRRYLDLTPADIAVRLNLIAKVHGLEQAEKYFNNIPKQSRVYPIYVALLNCYTQEKSVEKAEAHMEMMKELGFARTSLPYNLLLNLYFQMGQCEKLDILMQGMEGKGIRPDKFTFTIRLSAYAATSEIEGMEKILERMEADPQVIIDWNAYAFAADGYIKARLIDKALEMLKKSEDLVTKNNRRVAFNFLLTLYAGTGKKDELYRIWNLYKESDKVFNTGYMCMIGSLVKLDDMEGAEKILADWEAGGTAYDFRVPNLLIAAYCNNGLLEKAEAFINKAIESGKKPNASTWDCLATGYLEDNQVQKAVEMMKKAVMASQQPEWKPNHVTLAACLEYMQAQGDVEGAEEFTKLLGDLGPFPNEDGKPESNTLDKIEEAGFGSDEEMQGVQN